MKPPPCPNEAEHDVTPTNDAERWHAWAEQMSKTHRPQRCPCCGWWAIWVPKQKRPAAPEAS